MLFPFLFPSFSLFLPLSLVFRGANACSESKSGSLEGPRKKRYDRDAGGNGGCRGEVERGACHRAPLKKDLVSLFAGGLIQAQGHFYAKPSLIRTGTVVPSDFFISRLPLQRWDLKNIRELGSFILINSARTLYDIQGAS